jgi:predicted transposase YdaD
VRLWEQDAERLLASADVGLIPWVPLTRTNLAPDELMARCRQRLFEVPDPADRAGLAVTQILAGLAFPDRRFLSLLGGPQVMIESPVLDEVKEILRQQYSQQYRAEGLAEGRAEGLAEGRLAALRENILAILDARFGMIPPECPAMLQTLSEDSLKASVKLAATCTNLDEFLKQSTSDGPRNQS